MKILCDKKKLVAILVILIALGVIIMVYGLIMKALFKDKMILKDFMNYKLFDLKVFGAECCSLWPISHLVLYAVLAFIFPDCLVTLCIIGVIWEIIEVILDIVLSRFRKGGPAAGNGKVEYSGAWIQGNFKDVVFNTVGLAVGFGLRKSWDALKKKRG